MLNLIFFLILSLFFPQTASAHSEVQVIEMTKDGFEPQSVTIDENATVIFLNRDDTPRYPASNPHPTHDLYPEFDPKKPIEPGDSWPFRPKIGVWKYHDHFFPHMRGVITVTPESSNSKVDDKESPTTETKKTGLFYILQDALVKIIDNLQQFFTPKISYQPQNHNEFVRLSPAGQTKVIEQIAQEDPKKAWKYLKDAYKNENGSIGSVHDLAHLIGGLLYSSYGFEGLSFCSQEFAFGCYHGFLDKAFAKNLDHLLDAENACLELNTNDNLSGPAQGCIHGIGHGVASYYLTENLQEALKTCKKLIVGNQYCSDGVFMEFARSAPDSFYHKDDPLYPCDQLENDDLYANACGRNQPALLFNRFHMSPEEIATVCGSSESRSFKYACFTALGYSLVTSTSGDVAKITSGCQSIQDSEFMVNCLEAAAGNMVFQQITGWPEKSRAVCQALPSKFVTECLQQVEGIIKDYNLKTK